MTARLLGLTSGLTLTFPGEMYHVARQMAMSVQCSRGHDLAALETVAGIWFIFCAECEHAELAGPDILDTLAASTQFTAPQPARATVAAVPLVGPGE
jgi:hypothetical protein